jgi:hypothetical protein
VYQHSVLHDRQHPHDALVELSTQYVIRFVSAYVAAVGEPALGPQTYMHRLSAQNDPFAPLGHHWQDATHQSFGVATLSVHAHSVKLEGSIFNPREPDDAHLFADYRGARLDSYSGRLSWLPSSTTTIATWWGYLNSHDRLDPDTRMHRYGASAQFNEGRLSSTFIWGMNLHHHGANSHELLHGTPGASPHHHSSSLLAEANFEVTAHTAVFGRLERVMKSGEELGFQGGDLTELYDIRAISLGAEHRVVGMLGLGARGSVNLVPETLLATYGTRTPSGLAVYVHFSPASRARQP